MTTPNATPSAPAQSHLPAGLVGTGEDRTAQMLALAQKFRESSEALVVETAAKTAQVESGATPPADQSATPAAQPQVNAQPAATPSLELDTFVMPDKFKGKSAEEIARSYVELERFKAKQGAQPQAQLNVEPQAQPQVNQPVTPEATPAANQPASPEATPAVNLQLDASAAPSVPLEQVFATAVKEATEAGAVSDATKANLKAHGVSESVLNYHLSVAKKTTELEGMVGKVQEAQAKQAEQDMLKSVFGPQADVAAEFGKLNAWASANLSQAEKDAFNAGVKVSATQAQLLVQGLKARMEQTVGTQPARQVHGQPTASDVFDSVSDFITAYRDARYTTDSAYKASVIAKHQRSVAAGRIPA